MIDVRCILSGFYASFILAMSSACLRLRFSLYLDMHSIHRRLSLSHSQSCYVAKLLCVVPRVYKHIYSWLYQEYINIYILGCTKMNSVKRNCKFSRCYMCWPSCHSYLLSGNLVAQYEPKLKSVLFSLRYFSYA